MTASDTPQLELPPQTQEFIDTKLSSKLWRLDNLYTIIDKDGNKRIMRLNSAQKKVLKKFKHNKKIILKSRQQGISTLYLAYYLDSCIFTENFSAGIQSVGQDEADKLAKRAELMWEEFDPDIKELLGIKLTSNNQKGMSFSNKSILKIGNFRGDTLQGLHVSELGKIAKKYPDKARELKTGAFQAVGKNNKITVESTAEGRSGLFYEMWTKAEIKSLQKATLTPIDFQAIFLSWLEDPDCTLDQKVPIPRELEEYFAALEAELDITLTKEQKWWYTAKKTEELGDDMMQEYPATPDEAFMSIRDGSYYARFYKKEIVGNKRIVPDLYDPNLQTHVAVDLGMNDTTVMVFFQKYGKELRIVDEYHNSGEDLEHYASVLKSKGYTYGDIWLPHDAKVRELGTGKSRLHRFRELGISGRLVRKDKVHTGIEQVRKQIPHMWIDEKLTYIHDTFINYSKQWDDKLGVWKDKPLHDEWSNPADAIRYMCVALIQESVKDDFYKNTGFSMDV